MLSAELNFADASNAQFPSYRGSQLRPPTWASSLSRLVSIPFNLLAPLSDPGLNPTLTLTHRPRQRRRTEIFISYYHDSDFDSNTNAASVRE
ncbi:hypothetical protein CSOJ01_15381 [Colletotrichum sojae]|uniref:Uncharacterized protein n=1 Tax=Colletotrichum sojae TaxID=2175907 RepID=A0A8H6MI78_9PEZI|nr:hypothetical protein CSOJ01_15381 [Colletotrichum sojae]